MTTDFYGRLKASRRDDALLEACITRVVDQLGSRETSSNSPGMLLGKIQSGKTRAFLGVIALAFDRGFDIAIVLTKGTKSLSEQTLARLRHDFREFTDRDEMGILDIMQLPTQLTGYELDRKLVIVAKKQVRNLDRLLALFETTYPKLRERRILLIDDEADLASVRFVRDRESGVIEQGRIADKMDKFRTMTSASAFLQVTATPYSLYLQPETYQGAAPAQYAFQPKRPAFTEILPLHGGYVGGDDYFLFHGDNDPRSRLIVDVDPEEQDALRRADRRRITHRSVLSSPNTGGLVRAVVTFILGACIRRWQARESRETPQKYTMIVHNDTQRAAHDWQNRVLGWILEAITLRIAEGSALDDLVSAPRDDLRASVTANGDAMPPDGALMAAFEEAFRGDMIVRQAVNSDRDVATLLDEKAELKLRTPFNIFVGGNILDRGITIPNLIAFYYGRNPKTMQADTVLQHSRMYGNRDRRDLAVTRLHTSPAVSARLFRINSFENTLRAAFERGGADSRVVFIQADPERQIRPCAPNKVLLSNVVTLGPEELYLPTSFQIRPCKTIADTLQRLDEVIPLEARDTGHFITVSRSVALEILSQIELTLDPPDNSFEWAAMRGLLEYYSDVREGAARGQVSLLVETGRRLSRTKSGDRSGLSILGSADLRKLVRDPMRATPALILLQQVGTVDLGWTGCPFWWPILAPPATAEPCVFATKVANT